MVDAGGPVPGGVQVPLHVRIEGEEFPLPVEGGIIRIAKSGRDDLPCLPFRINLRNMTNRGPRPLHEMLHGRQQLVLTPEFGCA